MVVILSEALYGRHPDPERSRRSLYLVVAFVFYLLLSSPITPKVEAYVQKSGCLIYGAIMV